MRIIIVENVPEDTEKITEIPFSNILDVAKADIVITRNVEGRYNLVKDKNGKAIMSTRGDYVKAIDISINGKDDEDAASNSAPVQ